MTLDTASKTLRWDHALQPPDLPADFELVNAINIAYLVHMYGKDNVNAVTSVTVPVDRNYLDLDDDSIDSCEEQTFVVQAVVNNDLRSVNSSAVSGIFTDGEFYILILLQQLTLLCFMDTVPAFISFSARLQLLAVENVFAIQVSYL